MISWVISSSVLILTIVILRYLVKGKISLRLQYALWILAAVRLLVPVNFGTSILSVENLTVKLKDYPVIENVAKLVDDNVFWAGAEKSGEQASDVFQTGTEIFGEQTPHEQTVQGQAASGQKVPEQSARGQNTLEQTVYGQIMQNQNMHEHTTQRQNFLQTTLLYIWIAGVVILGMVFMVSNAVFAARVKLTRRRVDVGYAKIPVYVSNAVETPCLFGLFRTNIYITEAVAENPVLLRHSVAHEMTHYKHGDQLWLLIRCICLVLHWYNPVVWWAAVLSKQDAELACDEATIVKLGEDERTEYGRTLIRLTCEKHQELFVTATTMTSGKKRITERIGLIANKPKTRVYALAAVIVAAVLGAGCAFTDAEGNTSAGIVSDDANTDMQASDDMTQTQGAFDDSQTQGTDTQEPESDINPEDLYSFPVKVAEDRELLVALNTTQPEEDCFSVSQILVYEGEKLLQKIDPSSIPKVEDYDWEGLFVNQGHTVGEPDVRDLNFDGAEDFGLLAVSAYPKNVPYSYFLWNEENERFEYGFTLFGALALEADGEKKRLIETAYDTLGETRTYYEYEVIETLTREMSAVILPVQDGQSEESKLSIEPLGTGQYLKDMDWESMESRLDADEYQALRKYLPVLKGEKFTWIYRSGEGPEPDTYTHAQSLLTIQEMISSELDASGLDDKFAVIDSIMFADVFQSGEQNVCVLFRHLGWFWLILHEEDGIVYGIDMPVRWFEGVQKDGLYYGSGGAGMQHYHRMTFEDGDYAEEDVGDVINGELIIDNVKPPEEKYQEWMRENIAEEAKWYVPVE